MTTDPEPTPLAFCGNCGRIIVAVPSPNGGEQLMHWGTARPTCNPDDIDDPWAPRAVYSWDISAVPS